MSFEIGNESRAMIYARRVGTRDVDRYPGLGATTIIAAPAAATAPWMVGLPKAGDSKDVTRIAYAKRDHDLALQGNATAYTNLQNQAVGSATAVGKAWYRAALNDVNMSRTVKAPVVTPPKPTPVNTTPIPPSGVTKVPFNPQVLIDPIVKQATDMGLKVQQTSDGKVVGVNSDGAVVTKPLPVSPSQVTDTAIVPSNAVQANAPAPPRNRSTGILSILDKLQSQSSAPSSGGDNFVASQGPPTTAPAATPTVVNAADMTGGFAGSAGELFSNPLVLAGAALAIYFMFSASSGRRH